MVEWKLTIDTDNMLDFVDKHPELHQAILDIIGCEDVKHHTWDRIPWYHGEVEKVQTSTVYGVMGGADNDQ